MKKKTFSFVILLVLCMTMLFESLYPVFAMKESTEFTNKYGTPTTKCAHTGCNNYIASTGDTNCCTVHSNKCLDCGKYIDEDALYCMECLVGAIDSISNSKGSTPTSSSFTNKFGTPTTKCAHTGCNNYIASSGDTNCCVTHSNKCLECKKYIDEDAMYCMDCLKKASGTGGNSIYGSTNGYSSGSTGYGYDKYDPYYSKNDHNHDGKLSDEEFQDAWNEAIDDLIASYEKGDLK